MSDRHTKTPYPLRMPDELRAALEIAASAGNRSLHAEIVARLQQTFEPATASSESLEVMALGMAEAQKQAAINALMLESEALEHAKIADALLEIVDEGKEGAPVLTRKERAEAIKAARELAQDVAEILETESFDEHIKEVEEATARAQQVRATLEKRRMSDPEYASRKRTLRVPLIDRTEEKK